MLFIGMVHDLLEAKESCIYDTFEIVKHPVEKFESKRSHAVMVQHNSDRFPRAGQAAKLFEETVEILLAMTSISGVEIEANRQAREIEGDSHALWERAGCGDSFKTQVA